MRVTRRGRVSIGSRCCPSDAQTLESDGKPPFMSTMSPQLDRPVGVRRGRAADGQPRPRHVRPANGPPYAPEFLARFQAAQQARLARIDHGVRQRLAVLRSLDAPGSPRDQVFVIHPTHADPRCLDLTLDPNDREVGSVRGSGAAGARSVNYAASQMGRITSLTAFLSQWSPQSRADGPSSLARTSVPVLLHTYTADSSTFPSTRDAWLAAAPGRIRNSDVKGGNHDLAGQPRLVEQVAGEMADRMLAL